MRLIWLTVLVAVLCFSIESSATAQLIPRRNTTRPCTRYNVPPSKYRIVAGRSQSVAALSNRFVFLDNPLRALNLEPIPVVSETPTVAIVTPANEVSSGSPNAEAAVVSSRPEDNLGSGEPTPIPAATSVYEPADPAAKPVETPTKPKTPSVEATPGDNPVVIQRDKKLFQWREDTLQIDHCAISNMAVQLFRDGNWVLNLRADQNRYAASNRHNPTLHIKRNRFGIILRCFGNLSNAPSEFGLITGKPVLAEIKVEEFWVQNGKPEFLLTGGIEKAIEQRFDSIDRVEIEFFYYQ